MALSKSHANDLISFADVKESSCGWTWRGLVCESNESNSLHGAVAVRSSQLQSFIELSECSRVTIPLDRTATQTETAETLTAKRQSNGTKPINALGRQDRSQE